MRLVEVEKVLIIIENIKENKDLPKNYGTLLDIMRRIRELPVVDSDPLQAKWIEDGGARGYICSHCNPHCDGNRIYIRQSIYCPDCGAIMINGRE